jgi:hypothetical protein
MGANVYLAAAKSYGYKTETAATVIQQGIPPRDGERVAIRAIGLTSGATATLAYVMQAFGQSTITTAVASGATTGLIATADFQKTGNLVASGDNVAIELDDGTVQFTTVATGTFSNFSIAAALLDTVAIKNRVWGFGLAADAGHIALLLTASVQTKWEIDGGVFYADGLGKPVLIHHVNNATAAGSIDYVTVDYIER